MTDKNTGNYFLTRFTEEQQNLIIDLQKDFIINFADKCENQNIYDCSEMFFVILVFVISNMAKSLNIVRIDDFLDDVVKTVKVVHDRVRKDDDCTVYVSGKKVSDGKLN